MYSKDGIKKLKHDFWEGFDRYTKFYSKKIGEPIEWMLYKTGVKGLELKFYLDKRKIQVILEVNARSENRRFDLYLELNKFKKILEEGFINEVIWEDDFVKDEGVTVSRLFVEKAKITYHNRDNWPDIYMFMALNMFMMQNNLLDVLPILQEKFKNNL